MADNEHRVFYKILADFSALSKGTQKAKQDIRDLQAEEKKLNKSSAEENKKLVTNKNKSTKAYKDEASAVRRSTTALKNHSTAISNANKSQVAFNRNLRTSVGLHEKVGRAAKSSKSDIRGLRLEQEKLVKAQKGGLGSSRKDSRDPVLENLRQQTEELKKLNATSKKVVSTLGSVDRRLINIGRSAGRAGDATRETTKDFHGASNAAKRLQGRVQGLGKSLNGLHRWRPRLIPPFIALIPIIGAVLGLINPLIAGLGAVGAGALGFASSLSSLSGVVLSLAPGLATMLTLVSALKTAFGGIGSVFKKYTAIKQAAGASNGGGSQKEELTQADQLQRAQVRYARSLENVRWAQEDLTDARKGYLQTIKDLKKELEELSEAEDKAKTNALLASEYYAQIVNDPNVDQEDKVAAKDYADELAESALDAKEARKDGESSLKEAQGTGIEGDRKVIQAKRGLVDAEWAVKDAQLDLINTQKNLGDTASASATATNDFQDALDELSPSARNVVLQLLDMNDAWKKLKKTVQESFFSEIADDIPLLNKLFPSLTTLLSDTAGAGGGVLSDLINQLTSDEWTGDIELFSEASVGLTESMGEALGNILDIIKDVVIAVGPFAQDLADSFVDATDNLKELVGTARGDGSLEGWLDTVYGRLQQWWQILKNIGKTLVNYGDAASDFGDWITTAFQGVTEGWLDNSEIAKEDGSEFQKYLENIKPALSAISELFSAFFGWLSEVTTDPENIKKFTETIDRIREDLGPALANIFAILADSDVSDSLINTLASILDTLGDFLDRGGLEGFETFYDTATLFFDAVNDFINFLPEDAIGGIASSLAVISALTFFGLDKIILGLAGLLKFKLIGSVLDKLITLGRGKVPAPLPVRVPGATGAGKPGAGLPVRPGPGGTPYTPTVFDPKGGKKLPTGLSPESERLERGAKKGRLNKLNPKNIGKGLLNTGKGLLNPSSPLKGLGVSLGLGLGGSIAGSVIGDGEGGERDIGGSIVSNTLQGAGIGRMLGPWGALGGAIGGLGYGAYTGIQNSDRSEEDKDKSIRNAALGGSLFGLLPGIVAGAIIDPNVVDEAIATAKGAISTWGESIWEDLQAIGDWFSTTWDSAVTWVQGLPARVSAAIDTAGDGVWSALQSIGDWFSDTWDDAVQWLYDLPYNIGVAIGNIWNGIKALDEWFRDQWDNAVEWLTGLPLAVAVAVVSIWGKTQGLRDWLGVQWDNAVDWVIGLPQLVADTVGSLWASTEGIRTWLVARWDDAVAWVLDLPSLISRTAGNIWRFLTDLPGWLADQAESAKQWFKDLPEEVADWAKDIWGGLGGIGDWLATQTTALKTWIANIPSNVASALADIGDIPARLFNWFTGGFSEGFDSTQTEPTPGYIRGGMLNRGTRGTRGNNTGGPIYRAEGGPVPGQGVTDTVPSMLTPGEFVMRRMAVAKLGMNNLYKLNEGTTSLADIVSQKSSSPLSFFNSGGAVRGMMGGDQASSGRSFVIQHLEINNPVARSSEESIAKVHDEISFMYGF